VYAVKETENFGKPVLCGDVSSQKKSYGRYAIRTIIAMKTKIHYNQSYWLYFLFRSGIKLPEGNVP